MIMSIIHRLVSKRTAKEQACVAVAPQIVEVPVVPGEVVDGVKNMHGMIVDRASSIKEMSVAVSDIAESCSVQATSIHELHNILSNFSNGLDIMKNCMAAVDKEVNTSVALGEEAQQRARELQDVNDEVGSAFDSIESRVGSLSDILRGVIGLTKVLDDISTQTNLLALNATIEAAHAKEYGRGFGVVATEVKNLSEQSRQSSTKIKAEIAGVLEALDLLSDTVNSSKELIEKQRKNTVSVRGSFTQVGKRLSKIASNSTKVTEAFTECVVLKNDSIEKSSVVSIHSESIAATVQEMAASLEDQNSVSTAIISTSESLGKLIEMEEGNSNG